MVNVDRKNLMRLKKIKVVLTDVDGVLTDGGMYYTSKGDVMKKFHARDGMGVSLLRRRNIPTIIVTKEKTMMVKKWSNKMRITELFDGVKEKEKVVQKICRKYNVKTDEICFVGDDVNDIELLKIVGFSASPKDAITHVQNIVNYVCKKNGGEGVFREIADMIIQVRFSSEKLY